MRVYAESAARLRGMYGELCSFVERESLRSGLDVRDYFALSLLTALMDRMAVVLQRLDSVRNEAR